MKPIALHDVRKSYGAMPVIHGVDIDIEPGEFAVLVGPSGCGKSTLLRMLAGLESVTGGEIVIGDSVVNNALPKERDIAMVFQNYALYPHMTVAENMGFSLRLARADKAESRAKVEAAAEILGLAHLLDRYPRHLSGGQRQRVAMGRAIVRAPSVFLFDEPLSNLDAKLRVKMRTEIKELHQKLKTTVVYVTHDQIEAMTMADKIIVLDGGHVSQIGSPLELYNQPQNSFVASFIGSPSMNLFPAKTEAGGTARLEDGQAVSLPQAVAPGRDILFGIRPEHLLQDVSAPRIHIRVAVVEPTGAETLISAHLGETDALAALRGHANLSSGDQLGLSFDDAHVHLFDAESGLRIG
ncbi:sn-glycerol-3-phosphate ABC transporter ATP-binding protein UgpC [Roseobacter sp. HKCCD9010]|uniref:ABC transporter ATP-binding protein n=1 Tax=unclassified Roseobacter TaxID=196798 RepID=UPI0014918A17|nr:MULTISPECIES: sn-glycerol-3-phosphate ABC transporter ATP-binding protein UgpC [unclassified Roseobacter]MBF9051155.1 sn-glycerol-3-phosphate ABC transporter ATP-binding protein UgpC [Rhodobacterales bacterium HKCCD4356]NNV12924.1 sn-glycerol-3-phosphate ABC transporter ATP-binding protein UgpC [Roseobacter sp. HKCCD7357]NNV16869.1 sn-glycerol-3-phosphate ABC transporter ATP-binding protein UgpC [Roseobacter sp. HKCCD8768]NNV26499.1 sn-glycerol-3-phosphate ABC transporter ATP-binding protein